MQQLFLKPEKPAFMDYITASLVFTNDLHDEETENVCLQWFVCLDRGGGSVASHYHTEGASLSEIPSEVWKRIAEMYLDSLLSVFLSSLITSSTP